MYRCRKQYQTFFEMEGCCNLKYHSSYGDCNCDLSMVLDVKGWNAITFIEYITFSKSTERYFCTHNL